MGWGFGETGQEHGIKRDRKKPAAFQGVGMEQEDGARANQNQSRILPKCCHHVAGRSREERLWETVGHEALDGGYFKHRHGDRANPQLWLSM